MGLEDWWKKRRNDPDAIASQRMTVRLFWRRMAFFFIVGPPLMAVFWWREKGELTLEDAIGFGVVTLLFWPIGFWIVRRKNVPPW